MIHHPIVLGSKFVLLLVILLVLVVLSGFLTAEQFRTAVIVGGIAFAVGVVAIWVFAFKVLGNPDSRLGRRMVLARDPADREGDSASTHPFRDMIGRRGVTVSALRPSGTARVGTKRVSVVTEGEFIPEGAEVEVVSVAGSCVVVREVPPTGSGAPEA